MVLGSREFQEIVSAVNTKDALKQIEQRHLSGYRTQDDLARVEHLVVSSGASLPLVSQTGDLFASQFIKPHYGLRLPASTTPGTIIEYKNAQAETVYGQVTRLLDKSTKLEVEPLTRSQAVSRQKADASIRVVGVNDDFVVPVAGKDSQLSSILIILHQSEQFVIKLINYLLMRDLASLSSNKEIFLSLYLRILLTSGVVIGLIVLVYRLFIL